MEESQRDSRKGKRKTDLVLILGTSLILVAVVLAVYLFLHGETKTTGNWPEPETSESLICEIRGREYPFFNYDNSKDKTTRINMTFKNDSLDSISLIYLLYYDSNEEVTKSEAINHAALNLKMQNEGLGPDALGSNFARLSDHLKLSLYAKNKEINSNTIKYFGLESTQPELYDMDTMEKSYEINGFSCNQDK